MKRSFPLALKMGGRGEPFPEEASRCFYLAGDDPARWMARLASWPVDQEKLRLLLVGARTDPSTIRGCFVWLPGEVAVQKLEEAIPCRAYEDRILVPWPAQLNLPVTKHDAAELVREGLVGWHPVEGWIVYGREDLLTLSDLLAPPPVLPTSWNRAHPGLAGLPDLLGVEVRGRSPEVEQLLQEGQEDIGSKSRERPPREKGAGARPETRNRREELRRRFFKKVEEFTERFPEREGPRTWVNDLQDWARKNLGQSGDQSQQDLQNLLDLLRRDPDQGLQYAVPLGDHGAQGRGLAPPDGGGLGKRNVDFNLGGLFGGGQPMSSWMLPGDDYEALHRAYRDSANRELNLGRYRRAAYIFAHLLGDYSSAANALEQGKHFREAAILYERKLSNPRQAARCYANGALYAEAVRIYEDLDDYAELGRLYRSLEREEDSRQAWKKAIAICRERNEFLQAGKWAHGELGEEEQARELYREGWPQSSEADACLREELALYGGGKDEERALQRLEEVRTAEDARMAQASALGVLAELTHAWPDPVLAERIRDFGRLIASSVLQEGETEERKLALARLPSLEPGDELLRRDVRRFGRRKPERPPLAEPSSMPKAAAHLEKVAQWTFSVDFKVRSAAEIRSGQALLGVSREAIRLEYRPARGKLRRVEWPAPHGHASRRDLRLVSASHPFADRGEGFVILSSRELETRPLGDSLRAGNEFWHGQTLGFAVDEHGLNCQVALADGTLALKRYEGTTLKGTQLLEILPPGISREDWQGWMGTIPVVARREQVFLGLGANLLRVRGSETEWMEFPGPVKSLCATGPHARLRLAVGYSGGQALVWGDHEWGRREAFGSGLDHPALGFSSAGHLVAADGNEVAVYGVGSGRVVRRVRENLRTGGRPVAILPGLRSDQFRIVATDRMVEYRVLGE